MERLEPQEPEPNRAMEEPRQENPPPWERQLRKQLLLLATVLVSATYIVGLNPPGGAWQDNRSGYKAGDSILLATHRRRYLVVYYCNATALAASVVVVFLLLLKKPRSGLNLVVLRVAMVLALLGLLGASAAATYRIIYGVTLACFLIICVIIQVLIGAKALLLERRGLGLPSSSSQTQPHEDDGAAALKPKEWRKVLMLPATFTTAITYVAGLCSPSGYWDRPVAYGRYKPGDVLLEVNHSTLFEVFYYSNSFAFFLSILVVLLLTGKKLPLRTAREASMVLTGTLLGLLAGAYAAGTYRPKRADTNVYVLCLIGMLLAYIHLVIVMTTTATCYGLSRSDASAPSAYADAGGGETAAVGGHVTNAWVEASRKVKSLVLLLATLVATVTYQGGLNPPGGVWADDRDGHSAGDPILLSTHPARYKVFFYCNSSAFVASLAAIAMTILQNGKVVRSHTKLLVSMTLAMVALMGAYAAGTRSSIYVAVMAGGVMVYLIIHLTWITVLMPRTDIYTRLKKRHKRLLLVAIVIATTSYQAGLNPPGGIRRHGAAGSEVLLDNYALRFWAFFYCNTVSLVSTMALIFFFLSPNLYRIAIRSYALYGCIVLALLVLMAAYAAGSARGVETYAYAYVLIATVVLVIAVRTVQFRSFLLDKDEEEENDDEEEEDAAGPAPRPRPRPRPRSRPTPVSRTRFRSAQEAMYREMYTTRKYLMLLGILLASVTYQAGLAPPGGVWRQDHGGDHGGEVGSPVLYDRNRSRYRAFFYSNSTAFAASVLVVILQLQQTIRNHQPKTTKLLVFATNTLLALDILGLLAAYVAVTTRKPMM